MREQTTYICLCAMQKSALRASARAHVCSRVPTLTNSFKSPFPKPKNPNSVTPYPLYIIFFLVEANEVWNFEPSSPSVFASISARLRLCEDVRAVRIYTSHVYIYMSSVFNDLQLSSDACHLTCYGYTAYNMRGGYQCHV
jgi:hypothetical protein